MERNRTRHVRWLSNGPITRAVAKSGILIVRVDGTTPPVAAAGRTQKVGLPVGGIDGGRGEHRNCRVQVRGRRMELT